MQNPEGCSGRHCEDSLELPFKNVPHTPEKKMERVTVKLFWKEWGKWFEREDTALGVYGFT